MAKIKCEYCGDYLLDTEERCPHCGAVNENYTRVVKTTPKTIEELRSWYKARNLPPEETTRFFIGKNIKEPKAFGIYKDSNGNFIVYKNKADGQRAIRYKGKDEAYAVNELYLRLKEEILNQKSQNVKKRSASSSSRQVTQSTSVDDKKKQRRVTLIILAALFSTILTITFGCIAIIALMNNYSSASSGYYMSDDNSLYYFEGYAYSGDFEENSYRWWSYDEEANLWSVYQVLNTRGFILEFSDKDCIYASEVEERLGLDYDYFNIFNSHEYIDEHHYEPKAGYYSHNNELYYYLEDRHSSYGTNDNSGWYKYDQDIGDWSYYSSYDNKNLVNDELWYHEDDYYLGDTDLIFDLDGYNWDPKSFTSTTWYDSFLENEAAYESHYSSQTDDNGWDWGWGSDSDYDWDSGDSWDSWDTDWDSDW